jgi:LacI family transcriptional regulator
MAVTLKDIAAELGISPTTVSRALKDDSRITKPVRDRVHKLARKLGYRPNLMAKGLVSNKTETIGFLVDNLSWSFFSELAEYVQNAAEKHSYSVLIYSSQKNVERERTGVESFLSRGVDGLLVYATEAKENEALYYSLSESGLPVLFFNNFTQLSVNCVATDNYKGTRKAIEHLLELGHRKIGYIGSQEDTTVKQQRLSAYMDAFSEEELQENRNWIALEDDDFLYGYRVAKQWFANNDQVPTAILTQNDFLAFGIYKALYELGKRIPEDVSVVGFDDLDTCQFMHPPLTTVRVPLRQLAESALHFLIDRIHDSKHGTEARTPMKMMVEPQLIIRDSTAAPFKKLQLNS